MKKLLITLAILISVQAEAQKFWDLMQDPNVPINETYQAYMDYVGDRDPYDVPGSKQFFRWYEDAVKIAFPEDNLSKFSIEAYNAALDYQAQYQDFSGSRAGGNWQSYGPSNTPINGHNGKVDAMAFHPSDPNTFFIGGAFGLWRTTDGGANWTPFTDDYPLTGVAAVEISQSNPSVVYFLSYGYYDYGAASLGVFKSTDGGDTWSLTNFNYQNTGSQYGRTMIVDPNDENIVYVSTSEGIFKSTDGLNTYSLVSTFSPTEMVFNPLNSNKIYACNYDFEYSEDGGITWQTSTGIVPMYSNSSHTMAVTPADTSVVYVAITEFGGFGGLYKSTDGGASFNLQSNSPNIYGGSLSGFGGGGQGGYCLALTCSPVDPDKIFTGGIYLWTSDDGGITWYTDTDIAGTHADVQDLEYYNGDLWMGNDGGVFNTSDNGSNWTYYQNMQTSLIYRIAVSEQEPGDLLTGWQDNGSAYSSAGSWEKVTGGDGMYCLFDYTDNNHRFTSYQYGNIYETADGQNYNFIIGSSGFGVNSQGHFRTKIMQNRTKVDNYFVGKNHLYESTDGALNWNNLSPIPYTTLWNKVSTFDICQKNDNYIYVESVGEAFRSEDHGQSWINITTGTDPDSSYISEIVVSPHDSLHVWLVKSGSNEFSKVYESTDGGDNWTNISAGLPNIPINFLEYQKGSDNRVFVSTIAGIYYRDDSHPNWDIYGTGLPNCRTEEMTIAYETGTFYTTTYGRGIWTNDIILDSIAPVTDFRAYPQLECGLGNGEVVYLDLSTGTPTAWEWSFPGGSPASSTMPSPFVTYPSTGTYTAELITSNPWGSDTLEINVYVENITLPITMPPNNVEGFEASTTMPSYFSIENPDLNNTWEIDSTVGGFDGSNHCIMIENFANGSSGNHDAFIMEAYDIYDASFASLTFDVANKPFNTSNVDTLSVYVSNNCGLTWNHVFTQNGNQLATGAPYSSNYFIPQATDWNTYAVNINSFCGSDRLSLKFENKSGGGNNMYIDNINIVASNNDPTTAAYLADPTVICEGETIHFLDQSSNYPNQWEWTFTGGNPNTSGNYEEWVNYNTVGNFDVELISSNVNGSDTLIDLGAILVHPNPTTPIININGNELSTIGGYSYEWYWDGYLLSTGDTSIINVAQAGYYQVEITDQNGCKASSDSVFLDLSSLNDLDGYGLNIYPNPADDQLSIEFSLNDNQSYSILIANILGQAVIQPITISGAGKIGISTESLSNGLYIVQLKNEQGKILKVEKLLVDRK